MCSSSLLTCNNDSDDSDLTDDVMITPPCLTRHCQPRLRLGPGAGHWLEAGLASAARAWVTSSGIGTLWYPGSDIRHWPHSLSQHTHDLHTAWLTPIVTPEGAISRCGEGGQWQHSQDRHILLNTPDYHCSWIIIPPRRWSTVIMIPHSFSASLNIQPIV